MLYHIDPLILGYIYIHTKIKYEIKTKKYTQTYIIDAIQINYSLPNNGGKKISKKG